MYWKVKISWLNTCVILCGFENTRMSCNVSDYLLLPEPDLKFKSVFILPSPSPTAGWVALQGIKFLSMLGWILTLVGQVNSIFEKNVQNMFSGENLYTIKAS